MDTGKSDNRKKPYNTRLKNRAHAVQLLLMGLSYRQVANQTGYSLPTVNRWASDLKVKRKLERVWKLKKTKRIKKSMDSLPAFMEALGKGHPEIYLVLLDAYMVFTNPTTADETRPPADTRGIIMYMLEQGYSQRIVAKQTGSSTRTVNKIAKAIKYRLNGKEGKVNTASYSLSIFMVWLKKHHSHLHPLVEPIYAQYTNNKN